LVDATGSPGAVALLAGALGVRARVLVSSAATKRAALAGGLADAQVEAGFPWDLAARSVAEAWWRPPTDRGLARLEAELAAWASALASDGTVWAVWHKDEGGKRAERLAAERFDEVTVVNRASGWRVVALRGPRAGTAPEPWLAWEGPDGSVRSLAGSHAGGRVDPGTALLLAALDAPGAPPLQGARVLDLGCGSGVLAARAVARGAAHVLGADDDLAAVRRTAAAAPGAAMAWSDLLQDVPGAAGAFDVVLMNPPFHVGRQVVGALSRAFVAAALTALRPGGRLVMVANAALPYERDLSAWADWQDVTPPGDARFKVLAARSR
jgi:16S rRNA (guanine1207-N2)-methyltransferase